MRDQPKSISAFFRSALGAPLRNDRWSWGAINPTTEQLFLRVWEDERKVVDGLPCFLIQAKTWKNTSAGRPERAHQIELMRNGMQAYGVVCVARDISAPRRTIRSFKTDTLLKFGPVIDKTDSVYAVITGETASAAVRDRVRLPAGITEGDVRAALRRLASGESHQFGISTGWDVIYEGNPYPQKAVLGLAAERLAVRPLAPGDFTAGRARQVLTRLGFLPVQKRDREERDEQLDDAAESELRQRTDIGPTVVAKLVRARRGQGVFRRNLEELEMKCRITGLTEGAHLRAGHIKPWRVSSDAEKLDGNNGLLLSPHADHLFDRGSISFSDSGDVLVADALSERVWKIWGISLPRNVGAFRPAQFRYLDYHRRHVFLGQEDERPYQPSTARGRKKRGRQTRGDRKSCS